VIPEQLWKKERTSQHVFGILVLANSEPKENRYDAPRAQRQYNQCRGWFRPAQKQTHSMLWRYVIDKLMEGGSRSHREPFRPLLSVTYWSRPMQRPS
jgi:hypothetical protein